MSRRCSGDIRVVDADRRMPGRHLALRRWVRRGVVLATLLLASAAGEAHADTRADVKAAYKQAVSQFSNFEMEAAQKTLDDAIKAAKEASPDDPVVAPLLALKAGIVYNATGDEAQAALILKDAVDLDYNVVLPVEVRSEELQAALDKARESSSAPSEAVQLTEPTPTCGEAVVFNVLVSGVADGGEVGLYYRAKGDEGDFKSISFDLFGNSGVAELAAEEHADKDFDYFIYVYDAAKKPIGNKGDQENPASLEMGCVKEEPKPKPKPKPEPKPEHPLARFWINIGVGTGAGIAHGESEQSYQQLNPNNYSYADAACAISRWKAAGGEPQAITPQDVQQWYGTSDTDVLNAMVNGFDQGSCAARHSVKTGFAWAPFHIAPEFGFRVHPKIVLSVFARIQAVTATSVFRDDPNKGLQESFEQDIRSPMPSGVRTRPGFTIAGGAKVKYFLLDDTKKFRLFVGGMLGGGFARLRVPMGFANDRNGNSIPDDQERAAVLDPTTGACIPVWPYYNACSTDATLAEADQTIAASVAANADKTQRVDSVRLGPLMVGGLFGFNYQIVKNFALFAELNVGGWFWDSSSLLLDIQFGPAITF